MHEKKCVVILRYKKKNVGEKADAATTAAILSV
jgi:hypothetical protein